MEESSVKKISTPASGFSGKELDIEKLQERNQFLEDTRRAVFNILEDVSSSEQELKKKTEELQKFQQAVANSFDATVITDADGKIFYANHASELLNGFTLKEMIGKTPSLWGGQMPKEFYETMWRTIKIEKQGYAGELTNRRKDGTTYLSSLRIVPILDEKKEVKFFVGVERDITEERKSQLRIVKHAAELERANMRIEQEKERAESILRFLKSIGEGVYATDAKGNIIFMNESAETMSGKKFEEVENQPAQEVFFFYRRKGTEDFTLNMVEKALKKEENVAFPNLSFIKVGEKMIPVSGTTSLIRSDKEKIIGTITVFQDVTKRHELDQMKDSFLSVAAHQLRTPLGSMRWSMELLLNGDLGELPEEAKEALSQIYTNSERMITLVNDLLDVSRIDQNKVQEEKQPLNIISTIKEVIGAMESEAQKRSVKIIFKEPKDSIPAIMAPPKHTYEALENLVSNGIKYNRPNGSITIDTRLTAHDLIVTFKDTGIGIPKDAQSKIFSKFFRAQNAVLKETEGSGLGLSVVKSYLEEAKATISFESEENVGTTFTIQFPLHPTQS